MKFEFNKDGIKKYYQQLCKRVNKVREKEVEILLNELYTLSPKATGALASNYYCSVNGEQQNFNPDKTSPTLIVPNFTINDTISVKNECPYLSYVNYGTSKQPPQNFIERSVVNTKFKLMSHLKQIGQTDY